jgi:ABC-type bacteriocin/lantibiotic exporter with double-glycine peptidase domain
MRFQSNRSACGPAALHNALASLGIDRSEDELIKLAGQTPNGTNATGLIRAAKSIPGADPRPVRWKDEDEAGIALWYYISERGRPLILCVDAFDHWVACTGHLGTRFAVIDSADNALVLYYTHTELIKRWVGPKGGYHGIVL